MPTDQIAQVEPELAESVEENLRVVYLLGAGASHACATVQGSNIGILMGDLTLEIIEQLGGYAEIANHKSLERLVNEVITDDTDIEQIITFLDESGSSAHQSFAAYLREVFEKVLRARLDAITAERSSAPVDLYAALVDMHQVKGGGETLMGILTLNYDEFLESAITGPLSLAVDYGIDVVPPSHDADAIRVLKLHGSFGWKHTWPVDRAPEADDARLWIPPGIQKAKASYPFNAVWGMARELLDCDVLRIVGCNLGTNDWDLVSMLFAAKHTHSAGEPLNIELIDRPRSAERIKALFPYLDAKSLLEIDQIGEQIVSEHKGGAPRRYNELTDREQTELLKYASMNISNPFFYWLRLKAEAMQLESSITTATNAFSRVLEL